MILAELTLSTRSGHAPYLLPELIIISYLNDRLVYTISVTTQEVMLASTKIVVMKTEVRFMVLT